MHRKFLRGFTSDNNNTIQVRVDCEDPTYEVEGSDTIICQWNKTWSPQPFPGCVRKTCVGGQYLNKNGQCSVCPEGELCNLLHS